VLAAKFAARYCAANGMPLDAKTFSPEAFTRLQAYHWPGNIRELESTVSRAALSAPGRVIRDTDIEFLHALAAPHRAGRTARLQTLAENEKDHVLRVLESCDWNKKEAARLLDISRGTLYRKIVEYSLRPEPASPATAPPDSAARASGTFFREAARDAEERCGGLDIAGRSGRRDSHRGSTSPESQPPRALKSSMIGIARGFASEGARPPNRRRVRRSADKDHGPWTSDGPRTVDGPSTKDQGPRTKLRAPLCAALLSSWSHCHPLGHAPRAGARV
jgi:hypothetical protein